MWKHPVIQQLFGISIPIIQAPMAGSSNANLVASVSNAGGLGSLGAAALTPDVLRGQVQSIKQQTSNPFNVNLFASATENFDAAARPDPAFEALLTGYHEAMDLGSLPTPAGLFGPAEAQLAVLIEERVPVISFHFGVETHQVEAIHEAGLKVICSATTPGEARYLESLGVDAIIAQGSEAGGHRGTFQHHFSEGLIGTMALVPQILDVVSVPVIAAGGIMDGRGIAACAALGAHGVQMGTAFLACPETNLAPAWKTKLLNARPEDTAVTLAMSGKPARGIRNRYINEVEALAVPLMPYPLQYSMSSRIRANAVKKDDADFMALWSGQGVGMIQEKPAGELLVELDRDARERLLDA